MLYSYSSALQGTQHVDLSNSRSNIHYFLHDCYQFFIASFIWNSFRLLLKVFMQIPSNSAIFSQEKCMSLRNSICPFAMTKERFIYNPIPPMDEGFGKLFSRLVGICSNFFQDRQETALPHYRTCRNLLIRFFD